MTVPATLAGVVYTESLPFKESYKDFHIYVLQIQTTRILSICLCEPFGSFLIDYFAFKLLTIDPTDPAYKKKVEIDIKNDSSRSSNTDKATICPSDHEKYHDGPQNKVEEDDHAHETIIHHEDHHDLIVETPFQ